MTRTIVAVIVGYGVWSALWLAGNFGLGALYPEAKEAFENGEALAEPLYLGGALIWSVLCSLVAGCVTSRMATKFAKQAVLITACLLLATGVMVQLSVWEQMPLWYHIPFLLLLIPICWLGGRRQLSN